jgi:hypothetical protein
LLLRLFGIQLRSSTTVIDTRRRLSTVKSQKSSSLSKEEDLTPTSLYKHIEYPRFSLLSISSKYAKSFSQFRLLTNQLVIGKLNENVAPLPSVLF